MKIRNGFVSNSSSSSFIVATKGEAAKIPVTIEADLMDLVSDTIVDEEGLNRYFRNHYGWESYEEAEDYEKKLWDKMKKSLDDGNVLHCGRGSNEEYNTLSIEVYEYGVRSLKLPKGATIIQDDHG